MLYSLTSFWMLRHSERWWKYAFFMFLLEKMEKRKKREKDGNIRCCVFLPAFECAQHPKAGKNTKQLGKKLFLGPAPKRWSIVLSSERTSFHRWINFAWQPFNIEFYMGIQWHKYKARIPEQSTDPYPNKWRRTDLGTLEVLFSVKHMPVPLHRYL